MVNDFADHVWVIEILVYDFSFWRQVISSEIVTFDVNHEGIDCGLFYVDHCDLGIGSGSGNENVHVMLVRVIFV